jgi:hypothetical protein
MILFMKKRFTIPYSFLFTALLLCILSSQMKAQQTATEKRDEKTLERNFDGKRYKMYNNYVNFGIGYGRNFEGRLSTPVGVGYNFHAGKLFFQAGYNRSEMPTLWGSYTRNFLNDLHLAYCIRKETKKLNLAYVMGVGKVWGLKDNIPYGNVAGYAEIQFIRKIFYDVGAGLCLYVNYNRSYPMAGIRLDIFLSSAYQGEINGQ